MGRRKPFSNKQKKAQLQARKKRRARTFNLSFFVLSIQEDDDEDEKKGKREFAFAPSGNGNLVNEVHYRRSIFIHSQSHVSSKEAPPQPSEPRSEREKSRAMKRPTQVREYVKLRFIPLSHASLKTVFAPVPKEDIQKRIFNAQKELCRDDMVSFPRIFSLF